jgi:hypothetical protein
MVADDKADVLTADLFLQSASGGNFLGCGGMTACWLWNLASQLRGRFSKSQGFEVFFVFYCDAESRSTPRTHPHKIWVFAMSMMWNH